jgi:hypothetical protein
MNYTATTLGVQSILIFLINFLQSTQDIKRVISKRDGCEYLKQVPSSDGSLELIQRDPLATFC